MGAFIIPYCSSIILSELEQFFGIQQYFVSCFIDAEDKRGLKTHYSF